MTETGPPASRLTDDDRQLIAQLREAGAVLRARASDFDRLTGWQIGELADLAERLDERDTDA